MNFTNIDDKILGLLGILSQLRPEEFRDIKDRAAQERADPSLQDVHPIYKISSIFGQHPVKMQMTDLGLDEDAIMDYEGKILDVVCGADASLSTHFEGLGKRIYGIDAAVSQTQHRFRHVVQPSNPMPFADGEFDLVLSYMNPLLYLNQNTDEIIEFERKTMGLNEKAVSQFEFPHELGLFMFKESLRVTKPGGLFITYVGIQNPDMLSYAKENGYTHITQPIEQREYEYLSHMRFRSIFERKK